MISHIIRYRYIPKDGKYIVTLGMIDKKTWDVWIAKHLGMDRDEVLRLKQITGLADLFANQEFSRAWVPGKEDEK